MVLEKMPRDCHFFYLFPLDKQVKAFIINKLNPFQQGKLIAKLIEVDPVILKKVKNIKKPRDERTDAVQNVTRKAFFSFLFRLAIM